MLIKTKLAQQPFYRPPQYQFFFPKSTVKFRRCSMRRVEKKRPLAPILCTLCKEFIKNRI